MKQILTTLCFVLLVGSEVWASTTTPLLSSREYTIGEGDVEVSLFINPSFSKIGGASADSFQFNLGANYFLTDMLAPGLDFNFRAGGGNSFDFIPNLKAYLPTNSRVLPYMKAGLGYVRFVSQNYLALVLAPGVNYMLSNSVAIGAQLNYELGIGNGNYHQFQVPVQFALYFRY